MRKPTPKEQKLIELKAKGVKHPKAYRAAYDSKANDNTATVEATRTLAKPAVKAALEQMLARKNITLDRALSPIDKGLEAKRMDQYTGEVSDDIKLQLQASDRALKLLGVTQGDIGSLHLHLHQQRQKYDI